MASLGSFGAAAKEADPDADQDTFEFCGESFTVVGEVPAMVELTLTASLAGKVGPIEGDTAVFEALRYALTVPEREQGGKNTPADATQWRRFYQVAVDKKQPGQELSAVALNIIGWQVGRPTERRSTSESGSSQTGTNSNSSASDTPDSVPDEASAG